MASAVRTLSHFIAGRFVEPDNEPSIDVRSPVDGRHLWSLPPASSTEVATAVEVARAAQPTWEGTSPWTRADICHRVADLLDERRGELAEELTLEQGKPIADASAELGEAADSFRIAAENVKRLRTEYLPLADTNKRLFTVRKANGVYATIVPWNFPYLLAAELVAPAIVTGNAVILKPSEVTPMSGVHLAEILRDAGVPAGVLNLVLGAGDVGAELVAAPVDAVSFIGSHVTAEKVARAAALRKQLIEASGNGPLIVCRDADVAAAARAAASGAFFNAGQLCIATERVLVDAAVHDDFVAALLEAVTEWRLGNPLEPQTSVGPLTTATTAHTVQRHIDEAVAHGATVLAGGRRETDRPTDHYFAPTVVDGVAPEMLISRQETFGPVVPVITVADDEEAVRLANNSHLGLQMAVFTHSLERAFRYADALRAGSVIVNDSTTWWESHVPFGGASGTRSGSGRYTGHAALLEMTDTRTVAIDVGAAD